MFSKERFMRFLHDVVSSGRLSAGRSETLWWLSLITGMEQNGTQWGASDADGGDQYSREAQWRS